MTIIYYYLIQYVSSVPLRPSQKRSLLACLLLVPLVVHPILIHEAFLRALGIMKTPEM